ncbi:hypothetical protein F5Y06DRAFT_280579 [Hypoxylon sp. FL0890]|nr:hypothetical protein F5Y06DRAFT_280579 [Hypoxylon sp. FL0890]
MFVRLTVTDTMTRLIAVEAHDNKALSLNLLLRASLRSVAKLVAVGALGQTAFNGFTSILETLEVLFTGGPQLNLSGTKRLVTPAKMDAVLLVKVSLKVHVRVGGQERRVL